MEINDDEYAPIPWHEMPESLRKKEPAPKRVTNERVWQDVADRNDWADYLRSAAKEAGK